MDRPFIAYMVTNTVNGKRYIGITTKAIEVRWAGHQRARSRSTALRAAIEKYGGKSFTIEQIASALCFDDLKDLERILISQHKTISPRGYNLCGGGVGVITPSAETRARQSAALKGKPKSAEARASIIAAMDRSGFREKNRIALTGKPKTADHVAGLKAAWVNRVNRTSHKGYTHTPEAKAKMGDANRGRVMSDDTRAKMSSAKRGVAHTAIARANMSAAAMIREEKKRKARLTFEPALPL